jgi:hypothetical protein
MAIEKPKYEVIQKDGKFELRHYEPMILAQTQETALRGAGGFNTVFNYIGGNNAEGKKISMTAPVINEIDGEEMTIAFVMPSEFDCETLPDPNDPRLQLKEIPARKVAAVTFSGTVNPQMIEEKKQELLDWLKQQEVKVVGQAELARYNPPFLPGFIKRNEILIEVE